MSSAACALGVARPCFPVLERPHIRAQRSLSRTLGFQGIKSLVQFAKQITLLGYDFLLAFNSAFTRSLNSARCLGVRSDISSLSYNVNSPNSEPPAQY
jgi:hypothetical protein